MEGLIGAALKANMIGIAVAIAVVGAIFWFGNKWAMGMLARESATHDVLLKMIAVMPALLAELKVQYQEHETSDVSRFGALKEHITTVVGETRHSVNNNLTRIQETVIEVIKEGQR